ncbi:MAG: DUF2182 domain-containing protein [Actinocatenispora sp.]
MTTVRTAARTGTAPTTVVTAATVVGAVALAAVAWLVAVRQMDGMDGMDMGVATRLGPFPLFVAMWVSMMAVMMLPGAASAVARYARSQGRIGAAPLFVGSYLAVWAAVGVVVYEVYQPHGTIVAGAVTIMAGLYELTPLKRHCRDRCRGTTRSGFGYGLHCLGSSVGLMLILVALGVMSVPWMAVVAVLGLAQKLLPAKAAVDVPVALAIVGLGVLILVAPSVVPGLVSTM